MHHRVALFAAATLTPLPLLVAGALFGGPWLVAAILYLGVFAFALDELAQLAGTEQPEAGEFPAADRLSVALAVAHFGLLALALWAMTGGTGLSWVEQVGVFAAFGMFFGQISNANAHELIHRSDRRLFRLGMWVYISLLFGHHTSAHRHVHHRFVATDEDPNTARMGESFYAFALRAWGGSFRAGYEMEQALAGRLTAPAARRGAGGWTDPVRLSPYAVYLGGALACLAAAALLFGLGGLLGYLGLAAYAQLQLLMSDYVQHYGLSRRRLPGGRVEPVGPVHSWNAPQWFSSLLMLNAPRHSDHHAHPSRRFPELRLPAPGTAPTLPYSLPAMAVLALSPRHWFGVMNPRAEAWAGVTEPAARAPQPVGRDAQDNTAERRLAALRPVLETVPNLAGDDLQLDDLQSFDPQSYDHQFDNKPMTAAPKPDIRAAVLPDPASLPRGHGADETADAIARLVAENRPAAE